MKSRLKVKLRRKRILGDLTPSELIAKKTKAFLESGGVIKSINPGVSGIWDSHGERILKLPKPDFLD